MAMPGFTAEVSVYRTSNTYRATYGALAGHSSAAALPSALNLFSVIAFPLSLGPGIIIGLRCYAVCYTICRVLQINHTTCRNRCRTLCTRTSCRADQTPCGNLCCAIAWNTYCCVDDSGKPYCCPHNFRCCPNGCQAIPCS
jgi:hypothetical protein